MTGVIDPPAVPADGAVLGERYRLETVIGRGGYASVYRATDERLERSVALKIFAANATGESDSARVASETRVLASLTHPSLVTLFDARLDEDPPYLVMELIEGPTLTQRLTEGPVDPVLTATFAAHLAEALHVIHARGIVHRDLKPSNVLLRPAPLPFEPPRATLADFGIAYLIDSARVTATGTLIGTAAYLSPEQARGAPPAPAADIYSLGLVLLEAITGRRAYAQNTPHEALVARLLRAPEIPSTLPEGWRRLLGAMTSMDAAERPDAHAVRRAALLLQTDPAAARYDPAGITMPDGAAITMPDGAAITMPAATGASTSDRPTVELRPAAPTAILSDTPGDPAPASRSHRGWWIGLGAVVLAAAIGLVFALMVLPGGSPTPDPTLPALPEPLGEHLRRLLEQVRP